MQHKDQQQSLTEIKRKHVDIQAKTDRKTSQDYQNKTGSKINK